MSRGFPIKFLSVLAVPLLAILAMQLLAPTDTALASAADDGTTTISGYTVTNVDYTLNASNPANVDKVEFDLGATPPATADVRAKLVAAELTWYGCTISASTYAICTTSGATVASVDQLSVVVAD